ncbi:hypothetical protein [Tissierella sp. P1]|uniref:hypothetical protein n=1 Tax=Tissierella sp. P1 TaxID=1280483 RepID=UPI00130301A4|nr:hypothetical protein [Tissierella sp. P1]
MAVISLLALVAAIALGVAFGKNIGIISLATAMILGFAGGVSSNDIIAGFSTNLFLNMTGMFFFFSIAQANGALELLSKKVFKKNFGGNKALSHHGISGMCRYHHYRSRGINCIYMHDSDYDEYWSSHGI